MTDAEKRRQGTPTRLASRRAHYARRGWYVAYKRTLRKRIAAHLLEEMNG